MEFRTGQLDDPQIAALVRHHRDEAHGATPAANAHALDGIGLAAADVTFFSAWEGENLLAIGALRTIDAGHVELKSMRTAPGHLRRGAGRAMLDRLIAESRSRGFRRLSLETGTALMFVAANRLYETYGFVDCDAFGSYRPSPHNRFMTLALEK